MSFAPTKIKDDTFTLTQALGAIRRKGRCEIAGIQICKSSVLNNVNLLICGNASDGGMVISEELHW